MRNCFRCIAECVVLGQVNLAPDIISMTYPNHLLTTFATGLLIGRYRREIASQPWLGGLATARVTTLELVRGRRSAHRDRRPGFRSQGGLLTACTLTSV